MLDMKLANPEIWQELEEALRESTGVVSETQN